MADTKERIAAEMRAQFGLPTVWKGDNMQLAAKDVLAWATRLEGLSGGKYEGQLIDERDELEEHMDQIKTVLHGVNKEWSNNYGLHDLVCDVRDALAPTQPAEGLGEVANQISRFMIANKIDGAAWYQLQAIERTVAAHECGAGEDAREEMGPPTVTISQNAIAQYGWDECAKQVKKSLEGTGLLVHIIPAQPTKESEGK